MRLVLVVSSLGSGGAERVMTIMANYWSARGNNVTLLTFEDDSKSPFYELDARVNHEALGIVGSSSNATKAVFNNLKRIRMLRRAIRNSRPEVVISFIDRTNVIALIATRGLKLPVVVSERTDPSTYPIGGVWDWLRRLTYPMADCVVVQSKDALSYFSSRVQSRALVIPNPVPQPQSRETRPQLRLIKPSIIAMGRLDQEKGFDLLLKSFALLRRRFGEWTLTILGEGPLRAELESLRDELGLSACVALPGRVKHPHEVLKQADLFVMASRVEGFPNALCEAMACGLPVISTDCPSGPRNIVRHNIDGLLVPNEDVEALMEAMNKLMGSETERMRLGARALEVCERFFVDKIMYSWEQVLRKVTSGRMTIEPVSSRAILQKEI